MEKSKKVKPGIPPPDNSTNVSKLQEVLYSAIDYEMITLDELKAIRREIVRRPQRCRDMIDKMIDDEESKPID